MDLQKLDFLSSPISLYFNNKRTHTSKIGGILFILFLSFCLIYSCIILYIITNHLNVISLIYKKFEWEVGHYSMNATSLFHFFQLYSSENGGYFDKYNSQVIRIYTTYFHNNIDQSQLYEYDHWVFDECREGIDNKDINKDLFINIDNFTNAACIRYYYNSKNKNYYSIEEKEFIWPYLEHGASNNDNVFLTTLIEKCQNDSIITSRLGKCAPDEFIEKHIKNYYAFFIYLLDNSVDPTNSKNPFQHYFKIISSEIGDSENYVENYIQLTPVRIRTKNGQIIGKYSDDINSYSFDSNIKSFGKSDKKILLKFHYLMQNNINIYERRYAGLLDILSNIGGTIQLFYYFFSIINFIFNKYIIIMDTNHFFYKIAVSSHGENISNNKTIKPFKIIKNNFIGNNKNNKEKKINNSLNFSYKNPLDTEIKEINKEKSIQSNKLSKLGIVELKKNNFLINTNDSTLKNNYIFHKNSSNNNESFDYSNLKIKEINGINDNFESLNFIKEKEWNSNINKKIVYKIGLLTSKFQHKISKTDGKKTNANKKSFHFPNTDYKINHCNNFSLKVRPTFKMSNLEELLTKQKLNKDILTGSKLIENKFSFLNYILCLNKRKEEFKNLYSLVLFRRKILSENFIFHQYIINLLIGKKCGINPKEIKNLV